MTTPRSHGKYSATKHVTRDLDNKTLASRHLTNPLWESAEPWFFAL